MNWQYSFILFILTVNIAYAGDRELSEDTIINSVSYDWNDDGKLDRAVLVISEDIPGEADLLIYLSDKSEDNLILSIEKKSFVWKGTVWGVPSSLQINNDGLLFVTEVNDAIGRWYWSRKVFVSYLNKRFVVTGFTLHY